MAAPPDGADTPTTPGDPSGRPASELAIDRVRILKQPVESDCGVAEETGGLGMAGGDGRRRRGRRGRASAGAVFLTPRPDPIYATVHVPCRGADRVDRVIVCPPFAGEELFTYQTRRVWAEALAGAGHPTCVSTFRARATAPGATSDGGRLAAWRGAARSRLRRLAARGDRLHTRRRTRHRLRRHDRLAGGDRRRTDRRPDALGSPDPRALADAPGQGRGAVGHRPEPRAAGHRAGRRVRARRRRAARRGRAGGDEGDDRRARARST